jgi:hypothetical protein
MTILPRQRQDITQADIPQSVSRLQLTPQHARATPTRFLLTPTLARNSIYQPEWRAQDVAPFRDLKQ